MNKKNIAEIRRRMNLDKNNIGHIKGCYVSKLKEIVFKFDESYNLLPEDVAEKYLAIFRKTLSGAIGRTLLPVSIPTNELTGEKYKLLSGMREKLLSDDGQLDAFYKKVIETYSTDTEEGGYVILLCEDVYDIMFKSKNDEEFDEGSENTFSYFICAICPVSTTKSELMCDHAEKNFHSSHPDTVLTRPDIGFMYPAFEGNGANIYEALFYTSDTGADCSDFSDAIFGSELPMPAKTQKATFQSVLSEALEDECSFDVAESVREHICEVISDNKENRNDEPVPVTKRSVGRFLRESGVSDEKIETFGKNFDEQFGAGIDLPPENLVNTKQFEVTTPDVSIKVNPERKDLVQIREIDGMKYITVLIDDEIEVNGVKIKK